MKEKITNTDLPESLYKIGNSAFVSSSLRSVKLPQKIEAIPTGCFSYCASLDSIALPYNVKEIENRAFSNSGIKAVNMPGVTTIDGNAFSACTSLERAHFPNVVSIGQAAFPGVPLWRKQTSPPRLLHLRAMQITAKIPLATALR